MRQTLFYLPPKIFGFPLFGFGILFTLILIGVIVGILLRVRKYGMDADAWSLIPMGILAEAIVVYLVPQIATDQGFPIRGYGIFLLFAIVSAIALFMGRAKKLWNIPPDTILSLSIWAVIFGVIGARLFYIIEYWPSIQKPSLWATFIGIVSISEGGLVVYGSILGGAVGVLIFLFHHKLPIFATLDLLVPALLLGIAIGRLGCFMNGCCFGSICDLPWAVVFPVGSPAHYHQLEHNDVFFGGLKFSETSKNHEEKTWEELVEIDPSNTQEYLAKYAKHKRSRLQIEEVQSGSQAEKLGIRKGMSVIALGFPQTSTIPTQEKSVSFQNPTQIFLVKEQLSVFLFMNDAIRNHKTEMLIATDSPEPFQIYTLPIEPWQVLPIHPTQIYSAISAALGCCLLLFLSRFCKKDGLVFLLFLFYYPIVRFILEMIRTDEGSFLGTGFTVSQNISFIALVAACFFSVYFYQSSSQRAYAGRFPKNPPSNLAEKAKIM